MSNNLLNEIIEIVLPYIISSLELMGIFIVTWSGAKAFWRYIAQSFFKKTYDLQYSFAKGLSTALEFKMAAEILKTVLVREMSELLILGAIIVLRALVTILLKFEIRSGKKEAMLKKDDEKCLQEK
ncbi:MAG: DUF1622 domain-containing protein [Clostridia bacterium]|nr:DUF1622 domain-containing protein [Clostridia bacterium]